MSRMIAICLRCGTAQVRTDLGENFEKGYTLLKKETFCPRCNKKTNFIATKDINNLRKKLEQNPSKPLDGYILKLIKR